MNSKIYLYTALGIILLLLIVASIWFFFFRSASPTATSTTTLFGSSVGTTATNVSGTNTSGTGNIPLATNQTTTQKIFEIAQGPVAGATLIQTLQPTTTLARYVNEEDGHVYDLPLDVPGAVPRVVSDITIPGASRVVWFEQGEGAILQYIDTNGTTVKSVFLGLPAATTSTELVPTRIQFLPDNIIDLAASPDGASVAYLLKTSSGADGYTARADGTGAKKLFSLPLSQVLISWPSQGTLLAESKSAAGVQGITFSVDVKGGLVTPLLYAEDLTATADPEFAHIIYQSIDDSSSLAITYSHNIKTGLDSGISFDPAPERCIWSSLNTSVMYCAVLTQSVPVDYLDLWHQGVGSVATNIFSYNVATNAAIAVASPGSADGGVESDILEMALSPDEHYLSFTTKGSRELWGVRLSN